MKKSLGLAAILLIIIFSSAFFSCKSVKEYQKQYLNDAEMELSARNTQKFESNFHSYREAASGANGGKTGGGCGCN
jgi:peptidoglycan hydrolase CwlO-like protein